ncbi:MAG: T9SS type A sorting domain-containing protein [candidate division Zixibacteria bacterium]
MRIVKGFMLLSILFWMSSSTFAIDIKDVDLSQPFPLSLIDYPTTGAPTDPWLILDVDNIQINTDGTGQIQNEEMVCVNPTNPLNAVALWRDFREGYRRVGVGYTFDGGQTWVDTLLVVPPHPRQSDPVLAVDDEGNFFACTLCLVWGDGPSGIYVQKSTDGGVNWGDPVVAIDSNENFFEDKQWIAIDRSPAPSNGNIYIPWARFDADYSRNQVVLSASRDNGQSYGRPVAVSDGRSIQWPTVAVGMEGEVYVAWYSGWPLGVYMDVSYDEGETFGDDVLLADINTGSTQINGEILVFPYPALASDVSLISPYLGNVYVAHMDRNGSDMDIFFMSSNDGGENWSETVRINDDPEHNGADQFHPWITVDEGGVIHAIFYDRRLDDENLLFDLFYTRSDDAGQTWSENERITDVSSDPSNARLAGLIGEYIGLSATQGEVQMVWTDTRNGNQDVYSGHMSPTAVDSDRPIAPTDLSLKAPYPNPFNASVSISFYSTEARVVNLEIIDILGRTVAGLHNGICGVGMNRFTWDGTDRDGHESASGVYFAKLSDSNGIQVKRAVMLR